jgi:hypothetical protein
MKINGNFIKVAKSIIFEGLSAGGAEIKVPNAEKQKADITTPKNRGMLIIPTPNKRIAAKRTKNVIKSPNMAEANISPNMIAHIDIGEETSLSKVFIFVSHGAITGVIAETEKKRAIPNKPGIIKSKAASLLKENAMNKKAGISKPWIITGPLI